MQTTAGSLALVNRRVPDRAPLVKMLCKVILGEVNERANFRREALDLFGLGLQDKVSLNSDFAQRQVLVHRAIFFRLLR